MIIAILLILLISVIFKLALQLKMKQSIFFFIALMISYYVMYFFSVGTYHHFHSKTTSNRWMPLGSIMLILAMIVFGSNDIEDAWIIYIIMFVLIGSAFHLFGL